MWTLDLDPAAANTPTARIYKMYYQELKYLQLKRKKNSCSNLIEILNLTQAKAILPEKN